MRSWAPWMAFLSAPPDARPVDRPQALAFGLGIIRVEVAMLLAPVLVLSVTSLLVLLPASVSPLAAMAEVECSRAAVVAVMTPQMEIVMVAVSIRVTVASVAKTPVGAAAVRMVVVVGRSGPLARWRRPFRRRHSVLARLLPLLHCRRPWGIRGQHRGASAHPHSHTRVHLSLRTRLPLRLRLRPHLRVRAHASWRPRWDLRHLPRLRQHLLLRWRSRFRLRR